MTESKPAYFTHSFPEEYLDIDALKVIDRLERYGHVAYMVGGCVRDLLLGIRPKDYDLATSASPQQARKLFRNSRIIGRRFRLVHVTFRGKIIELSTFRANIGDDGQDNDEVDDSDLLIRSDNIFGTPREDALRRDFTINALFYSPSRESIIDYVGGIEDLRERRLRTIGDAAIRFQEDPVRIIRAIKLAVRLNLDMDEELEEALSSYRKELLKGAPPRILEEMYKILGSGFASETFRAFYDRGLLEVIMPGIVEQLKHAPSTAEKLFQILKELDKRDGGERKLSNPVLLGGLFLALFDTPYKSDEAPESDFLPPPSERSINDMIRSCPALESVSRRDRERLREIVLAQKRFMQGSKKGKRTSPNTLLKRSYFCEAYQIFSIAATASGVGLEDLERWQKRFEKEPLPKPEFDAKAKRARTSRRRRPPKRRPPRRNAPH